MEDTLLNKKTVRGFLRPHWAVSLFTLLVGLSCFALMLFVLDNGKQRAVYEQEQKTRLLAHAMENTVIRSVQDVLGRLNSVQEALLLNPGLQSTGNPYLSTVLQNLLTLTPSLREVVVHDAQGNWLASSRQQQPDNPALAAHCNITLRQRNNLDYLIDTPQSGRFLGSRPSAGKQQHIPLCVTVRGARGQISATVTGVLNPGFIHELFRPALTLNPVTLELYHYNGQPLVRNAGVSSQIPPQHSQSILFKRYLPTAEFGLFHQLWPAFKPDGSPRNVITSYRSTSPLPLVMVVNLDLARGLQPWDHEASVLFWIFVALIGAVAIGGTVLVIALRRKLHMESRIQLLTTAISSTANAIFITDQTGRIEWVNQAFESLTGWKSDQAQGKTPRILNSGKHDRQFFQHLWQHILAGNVWRGQITNMGRNQSSMIIDQTITPILDQYGEVTHFIAVHEDVTARTEAEQQARFLADHDSLTLLPNRRSFALSLNQSLEQITDQGLTVLFIDLDNFKTINDTLGHQAGDKVLCIAAERMSRLLPDSALLARLGGDEFAILIREMTNPAAVQRQSAALLEIMALPISIAESTFNLSISIGITFAHSSSDDVSRLLRQADLAMYKSKQSGRNTFSFFDEEMDYVMHRHVELEQNMRKALSHEGGFSLCYQPVIDAVTLEPASVEVLMRWQNRHGEWISPAEFIPVAEDSGLILELGHWQLDQLFAQLASWKHKGLQHLRVSINISAVQLTRENIAEQLVSRMFAAGLQANALVVEVTETTLMTDNSQMRENLAFFHDHGIDLSIDDFGTGYSSLRYISELYARLIKIDRSFIIGIGNKRSDEEIILATIALAKNLDMQVVAEGVETAEQLAFLRKAGADYIQGYYFARPMFEPELVNYIQQTEPA